MVSLILGAEHALSLFSSVNCLITSYAIVTVIHKTRIIKRDILSLPSYKEKTIDFPNPRSLSWTMDMPLPFYHVVQTPLSNPVHAYSDKRE